MVSKTYWQRKIVALFHDPPDKALQISGHINRASVLMQLALQGLLDTPPTGMPDASWVDAANRADTIASAADRPNFPRGVEVLDWTRPQNSLVIHPLSGQKLHLKITIPEKINVAQEEAVKSLIQSSKDPQKLFLLFWRCFEEELHRHEPNLPWEILPADTRIPNHSLLHHNRITSVFAVIEKPATLVFSIGPVQSFIANARKTRDLWIGSYLLSYLIWQAIKVIAEKLGPDHLIYPSLLEQPLVDLWLSKHFALGKQPEESQLRLATFPNKFVAIVPAEEAENLAKECGQAVRSEWKRLAEGVWKQLIQKVPEFDAANEIWQRQIGQFPEIYWSIYKWSDKPEEIARLYKELTGDERFEKLLEIKGAYPSNQGTVYAACHDLAERALAARKATRNFEQICEPAGKCTVCGEREILHDSKDWEGREFWRKVAQKLLGDIRQDGSERLCAICTVKRLVQSFVLKNELGLKGGFPSTDSVAAATFVKTILEKWEQTQSKVRHLTEKIEGSELREVAFTEMDIPKLNEIAEKIGRDARKFIKLDGEWFFTETYDIERVERAHGVRLNDEDVKKLRRALEDLYEIAGVHPADYYAILFMDGDGIGKWISGTHENLVNFGATLHPKAFEQLKNDDNWQKVLNHKRLISPSLHAAISQALANFALHFVPYVVEELHCGRVVYAGGDDVLAFLPITEVLSAARELRALFSGEAEQKSDGSIEVEFGSERFTGWIEWNKKMLLTMGNKASASIGVVIVHRLHPLRDALQQAREALEDAKKLYNRNAICVRWLKRSGERVQVGAQFAYPEYCIRDTIKLLLSVKDSVEEKKISKRFATSLMEESYTLAYLPAEVQEAELLRLLRRHSKGDKELKERFLPEIANQLVKLAGALNYHAKSDDPYDLTKPQSGLVELAKWLRLTLFLVGGE